VADHFADRFWTARFWNGRYYQSGTQVSGTMRANLSGAGSLSAAITQIEASTQTPQRYGGGGAPIWPGALEALFKKKKPKKEEIVREVAEVVAEAVPLVSTDESRLIAMRMAEQMTVRQLRQIQTIDALIARVEAEIAEMDDEEVLLLAA
jgi:hypothetical protein